MKKQKAKAVEPAYSLVLWSYTVLWDCVAYWFTQIKKWTVHPEMKIQSSIHPHADGKVG